MTDGQIDEWCMGIDGWIYGFDTFVLLCNVDDDDDDFNYYDNNIQDRLWLCEWKRVIGVSYALDSPLTHLLSLTNNNTTNASTTDTTQWHRLLSFCSLVSSVLKKTVEFKV